MSIKAGCDMNVTIVALFYVAWQTHYILQKHVFVLITFTK